MPNTKSTVIGLIELSITLESLDYGTVKARAAID